MSTKHPVCSVQKTLILLLLGTFFWQTRIAFFARYEVFDYLIPFVYLSDLLIAAVLLSEFVCDKGWLFHAKAFKDRFVTLGIVLFVLSAVASVFLSGGLGLVGFWYKFLKISLFFLFALWMGRFARRYGKDRVMVLLSAAAIPLVILGLAEMALGRSLSLQLIGEWRFGKAMPGITTVAIASLRILRPYATFPHPNLFGAMAGIFSLYWFYRLRFERNPTKRSLSAAILALFVTGLVASMSRTAWIGIVLAVLIVYAKGEKEARSPVLWRIVAFVFAGALLVWRFSQLLATDSLSFVRRLELAKVSVSLFLKHPIFGVGLNRFLLVMDDYWLKTGLERFNQPVHNVYLMVLVETGIVGFVGVALVVPRTVARGWRYLPHWLRASWFFIAVTGLFDHYWWTLQQGLLLLFLTLGLTFASMEDNEDG